MILYYVSKLPELLQRCSPAESNVDKIIGPPSHLVSCLVISA